MQPPTRRPRVVFPLWQGLVLGALCLGVGYLWGSSGHGTQPAAQPAQMPPLADVRPTAPAGGDMPDLPPGHPDISSPSAAKTELTKQLQAMTDRGELVTRGDKLMDSALYDLAAVAYERALELDRNDPNVLTDLGVCYRDLKRPKEAVGLFREAAGLDPKHAMSRLNIGVVEYFDLKDPKQAEQALRECLQVAPAGSEPARRATELLEAIAKERKPA